jgi:hypothetical protein
MLVFAKSPRGVLYLNNQPIHGRETGMDPVDIPFDLYDKCKDGLEDATYREGYLQKKFEWNQGEIAFTYGELRWLPEKSLRKIAKGLKLDESKRETKKQLVEDIKRVLRDVVTA